MPAQLIPFPSGAELERLTRKLRESRPSKGAPVSRRRSYLRLVDDVAEACAPVDPEAA